MAFRSQPDDYRPERQGLSASLRWEWEDARQSGCVRQPEDQYPQRRELARPGEYPQWHLQSHHAGRSAYLHLPILWGASDHYRQARSSQVREVRSHLPERLEVLPLRRHKAPRFPRYLAVLPPLRQARLSLVPRSSTVKKNPPLPLFRKRGIFRLAQRLRTHLTQPDIRTALEVGYRTYPPGEPAANRPHGRKCSQRWEASGGRLAEGPWSPPPPLVRGGGGDGYVLYPE